jgi:GNAT superfamily N-acetyltransferase
MQEYIRHLTPALEERIRRNPSLNIDTFIIPSPYVKDERLEKDYEHSYVWEEEGEILGYLFVYSNPERNRFHLYKQVTSPFGRGKGIGSACIQHLAAEVVPEALLYLYIWEKQQEAILFFVKQGFTIQDRIVYRGLVFNHMVCRAKDLKEGDGSEVFSHSFAEELGKTRHDARKTLRLLSDMVDRLSIENCHKIIEDINRESTALINMLNAYRDSVERFHEVNIKSMLLERILPFIELSAISCDVNLVIRGRVPEVYGPYTDYSRALVNLASNSLDAIRAASRKGKITIELKDKKNSILLTFKDNGIGIEPDRLHPGKDGLPRFVGKTTKTLSSDGQTSLIGKEYGQGIGTRQIFAVFGKENIQVTSRKGKGTIWKIYLPKRPKGEDQFFHNIQLRYHEFTELTEQPSRIDAPEREMLGPFIWRLRKMEIFLWDLVMQFSKYHNIREIFRTLLSYRKGFMAEEEFQKYVEELKIDYLSIKTWLCEIARQVRQDEEYVETHASVEKYGAMLLKSYGQATDRIVIFTLDPETGRFMATDRKLSEHVDFVPYLKKSRENLLRGEFSGDVSDPSRPIMLGVWTIRNLEDALGKIARVRQGAQKLVQMGINREKCLVFYPSTFLEGNWDLCPYITLTLGELAEAEDVHLKRYLIETENGGAAGISAD